MKRPTTCGPIFQNIFFQIISPKPLVKYIDGIANFRTASPSSAPISPKGAPTKNAPVLSQKLAPSIRGELLNMMKNKVRQTEAIPQMIIDWGMSLPGSSISLVSRSLMR